jgi:hypothetical protein
MWWSRQGFDFEAIVRKHIDRQFSLFASGEKPPSQADIAAFERDTGCVLPSDFRAFSQGPLGGLYVEVKEAVWPGHSGRFFTALRPMALPTISRSGWTCDGRPRRSGAATPT